MNAESNLPDGMHGGEYDSHPVEPKSADCEELIYGAMDAVNRRFERTLGFKTVIDDELFRQCAEVARLAVELARLEFLQSKNVSSPASHLAAAADLIQDSAKFIAIHPEREQEASQRRFMRKVESRVPLDRLRGKGAPGVKVKLDDGTVFGFPAYASESPRGFEDFVSKHFRRVVASELEQPLGGEHESRRTLREELMILLKKSGVSEAIERLDCSGFASRVSLLKKAIDEIGKRTGKGWASKVVRRWVDLTVAATTRERLTEWARHGIPADDLQRMARTRQLANLSKGTGKKRKSNVLEETGGKRTRHGTNRLRR